MCTSHYTAGDRHERIKRLDVDKPAQLHNSKPIELLTRIKMTGDSGIYVLIDFHPYTDDPVHTRLLKDISLKNKLNNEILVKELSRTRPLSIVTAERIHIFTCVGKGQDSFGKLILLDHLVVSIRL